MIPLEQKRAERVLATPLSTLTTTRLERAMATQWHTNSRRGIKAHGETKTPLYVVWKSMLTRTRQPNHTAFARYGGRGIRVCTEWEQSFETFRDWAKSNGYQPGLELDRINNDGNYEPANCRWVDRLTQVRNSSACKFITYRGLTAPISQHAENAGLKYLVVQQRLKLLGWSVEKALETPVRKVKA